MNLNTWQFWVVVAFCLLLGALIGYFLSWVDWLPPLILAGLVGYIGGVLLYNVAFKYIQSYPTVVYWVTIAALVLTMVILAYFFPTAVVILTTAIVGSYAIVRGCSFMIGGYPDERQVYHLVENQEYEQVKNVITN